MNSSSQPPVPAGDPALQPDPKDAFKKHFKPVPAGDPDAVTTIPPEAAKGNDEVMSQQQSPPSPIIP